MRNRTLRLITTGIIISSSLTSYAQNVGIGTATPAASAKLDITSTNSGLLVPRVALTATNAAGPIAAPATSLLVFNTATAGVSPNNVTPGFYYWDGTKWVRFASGLAGWELTGNTGTVAGTNFIGTTDAIDFVTRTNNTERMRMTSAGNLGIGIGMTAPTNKVDISAAARSGSHASGQPLYVTGTIAAGSAGAPGVEFRHDNGTQGIGFGYNTIYATGSNAAQDLGMSSRGTGNLNFTTNAAQRMIILGSNGNVGMGVTNPAYGLELNSTFGFGNGSAGTYRSRTETRDDAGQMATQSGMYETSNPTNYPAGASSWWHLLDVRHSNNANNYAMQIAGSFFDQEIWFRKTNNNGAQAWTRLMSSGNLNTYAWTLLGNTATNAATNFIGTTDAVDFVTRTSNAERMRVTSAGNVGIGITAPTQKLDVQGGNARINNAFIGDVGHGAGWGGISHSAQNNTTGYALISSSDGNYTLINKQNTGGGYIGFRVGNTDRAVITNAGNMGIGNTAPAYLLDVNGTIRANDVFAAGGQNIIVGDDSYLTDEDIANLLGLRSTTNSGTLAHLSIGGSNQGQVSGGTADYVHAGGTQTFGTGGQYLFAASRSVSGSTIGETGGFFADGNSCAIWSPGDGNQGQPAALLYFMDEDFWDNTNTNPYDNTALKSYINTAGALVTVSDMNKKTDIKPISGSLSRLLSVGGYEYKFKLAEAELRKGQIATTQSGVLAQEIKQAFPAAVEESAAGDMFVNYSALIPYVIEAVKEQQQIIDQQGKLIQEQQQLLLEMKKELEKMKAEK